MNENKKKTNMEEEHSYASTNTEQSFTTSCDIKCIHHKCIVLDTFHEAAAYASCFQTTMVSNSA